MSLRVVCDGRPLQPGFKAHLGRGIGRYAREIIAALEALDNGPRMELLLQNGLPDPELFPSLPRLRARRAPVWLPAGKRLLGYHWLARRALAPSWRQGRVVHFMSHLDAPCRVGPRTVIMVHDLITQKLGPRFQGSKSRPRFAAERWLETRCLYQAARIIANSEHTKQDLVDLCGLDPSLIKVIHLAAGADLAPCPDPEKQSRTLARYGLDPKMDFFLYLGGVDPRKDLHTLLAALKRLRAAGPIRDLVLAGKVRGDRAHQEIKREIKRLRLEERVHFTGFVEQGDLPALFSACRAFVYPSLYEGFGLPPLEAMACGAPVVATRAASLPEVLGEAAILVRPGDADQMADALAGLAANPELAADLTARGLKRAARFSWPRAAAETLAVYEEAAHAA